MFIKENLDKKKEIRSMEFSINKVNCAIIFAKCSCPTGESGSCNHIIDFVIEIAHYSLHYLISVPQEKTCTTIALGCTSSNFNYKTSNHEHNYKEQS